MLAKNHFLLKTKEADCLEVVLLSSSDLASYPSSTRTYQYIAHKPIEASAFELHVSEVVWLFLVNHLLCVDLTRLPLCLHFLKLYRHGFLAIRPLLDLFNFVVKGLVKFCDVRLGTVYVLLIVGLEFKDFLFEL